MEQQKALHIRSVVLQFTEICSLYLLNPMERTNRGKYPLAAYSYIRWINRLYTDTGFI